MLQSKKFPHYKQQQSRECGAVCLRMIAKHHGKLFSTETLLELARQRDEGATLLGISEAAEAIGMHTVAARLTFSRLIEDIPLPGIAHWKGNHFVVVVKANELEVVIADPAYDSIVTLPRSVFLEGWTGTPNDTQAEGVILLMEPTPDFFKVTGQDSGTQGLKDIWSYFSQNRGVMLTLFIGMAFGLFLMLVFPFIVQTLVDRGIENKDPGLLYIFLLAWVMLFIGKVILDMARSFLTFHLGSKVNIRFITSFMQKVMQLPLRFFASRMPDDVMQLFYDNARVQRFLTTDFFSVIYSGALLILLSGVLLIFSTPVFLVFLAFTLAQGLAVFFFLRKRKEISYERHKHSTTHFGKLLDIIRGMSDIRLSNAAHSQRWSWEKSEAQLYRVNKMIFNTGEFSRQVPFYLGEFRNIFIIFLAALSVINGQISVGILVAIVFILMQIDNPFKKVVDFFLGYQETIQIIQRMDEIKSLKSANIGGTLDLLPSKANIRGEGISFRYGGEYSPWAIRDLDFTIQYGRSTAIIGSSGSGKTTLLNLLLKTYTPETGIIKVGDFPLNEISDTALLEKCGVVQQDGHIFSESIARNIALGAGAIDSQRLIEASQIANVFPFLERMHHGFKTVIGEGGVGLSKGQKQCILIARALYRNPEYLFLDEATNDLDYQTEKTILSNIKAAMKGKTLVVFASRMPTDITFDDVIPLAIPKLKHVRYGETNVRGGRKRVRGNTDAVDSKLPM